MFSARTRIILAAPASPRGVEKSKKQPLV